MKRLLRHLKVLVLAGGLGLASLALAQTGDLDRCFNLLSAQDYARAQALAKDLVRAQPNDRLAQLCLGRALFMQGQFREALAAFQAVERLSKTREELSVAYNWLGLSNDKLGDADNALFYTQRSLKLARELGDRSVEAAALNNLAFLVESRGELDKALEYYEVSLRLTGDEAEKAVTWNNIANIHSKRGDYPKAVEYLQRAVEAARRSGDYHGMGQRLLNLGDTYRKQKRFLDARQAIEEGLSQVRKVGDRDWEATGETYYAWLLRDAGERQAARQHFEMAARLYEAIGKADSAQWVRGQLRQMIEANLAERVYAGIEIGSKGVKGVVMKLRFSENGFYDAQPLYRRSINPTAIVGARASGRLLPEAIEETAQAVKTLAEEMRAKGHAPAVIAASSAISALANRDALAERIAALLPSLPPINANQGKPMFFIDAKQETLFGILGAVPPAYQEQALLVDVGSGNTKLGYVTLNPSKSGTETVSFAIPLGSVTLSEAAAGRGGNFAKAAQEVMAREAAKLKVEAVRRPAYANRAPVVLIGGAAWAAATLLYPELATHSFVELKLSDIVRLRAMLEKNTDTAMNPGLQGISDSSQRVAAEKELAAVRDAFSRENLIAGLTILINVGEALGWKDKPLYFARHGSWLDGLIQTLGAIAEESTQSTPAKTGQSPANDAAWRKAA